MKKYLLCFFGFFILLTKLAVAEVLVNENFDDGAFYPPMKYCDTCAGDDYPCIEGCTNTVEHVSNVKKAGAYSLEAVYNTGGAAGFLMVPTDYGYANFGTEVYLRIYVKWDSGFRFYSRTKLFRWHGPEPNPYINTNACKANGIRWNPGGWWEGGSSNTQYADIAVYTSNIGLKYVSNEMGSSDWVIEAGDDWWMIEFHANSVTNKFDLWVQRPDDAFPTKVFNNETLGVNSAPFSRLDVNWINDTSDGSGGKMWIDEVVIADEYIEPFATRPSAPKGLRIIDN